MLGDRYIYHGIQIESIADVVIAEQLAKVAEHLNALGSLQAADALVPLLIKAEKLVPNMQWLKTVLVTLARRLDATGAMHLAETCAAAVRDPKTPVLARALLADAFAVVSARLDSAKAAPLESDVIDALIESLTDTDATGIYARTHLGEALASVCGHPDARTATRVADALTAAIRDPQTQLRAVKPLAAALAVVCSQLPPAESSSYAKQAVDALHSLWIARTAPVDRVQLAQAMAAIWTHIPSGEVAAHAKPMAADIQVAFRDPKASSSDLGLLAESLLAACDQLEPTERSALVNDAVDVVVTRLPKPNSRVKPREVFSGAIGILWLRLSREDVARVGDTALLAALGVSDPERYQYEFQVNMFKKIAAQMDVRDLERILEHPLTTSAVRRAVLDVLGKSKNRHFRSTWDYLDWSDSDRD
jgi:hypothetical protein